MVTRELKSIRKEKTILFAIMIQFVIASLSSILLLGLMAFYDPDSIGDNPNMSIKVGIIGDKYRQFTPFLLQKHLTVKTYTDPAQAESAFKAGNIDCIAYIPDGIQDTVDMKLILPDMDSKATIVLMILKGPLKDYENSLRKARGVSLSYSDFRGKGSTSYDFLYTIIIPILMFFPAFVAGSMVVDTVSEEIQNKTMATLLSAPVSLNRVLGAKLVASIIIALFQCILWIILLLLNKFTIQNIAPVLLFAVIVAAIVSTISLLISILFRDRERSQFVYSMSIVLAMGIGFFLNPTPFGLIARLATGDYFISVLNVLLYLIPLLLLLLIFPLVSKKIVSKLV
jgi:ABC-2 type transport system permease protein